MVNIITIKSCVKNVYRVSHRGYTHSDISWYYKMFKLYVYLKTTCGDKDNNHFKFKINLIFVLLFSKKISFQHFIFIYLVIFNNIFGFQNNCVSFTPYHRSEKILISNFLTKILNSIKI